MRDMPSLNGNKIWLAKWIWNQEDGPANTWMCFRKNFQLEHIPASAKVYIGVDSKYWLWINGRQVVFEGGLNRGPKPGAGYFDVVDLKGYLSEGQNTIAILVWYWGNQGRNSVDSGKGGLIFEAELDSQYIVSDKTWKVKPHPAYGKTEKLIPAYLYGGHNIGFDARKDIEDWNAKGYDDSDWEEAVEKGSPTCEPWDELYERPIPLLKNFGIRDYTNLSVNKEDGKVIYTASLPYASQITTLFSIKACREGLVIDIRTDRYEINGGPGDNHHQYKGHRTEYITKAGVQVFESLDWIFGEEVIYTFPEGIEVLSLKYRETGYDADFSGKFKCSDSFLNNLYDKCRRTLYICMRDNYMDCPDRERGQWIGDVSSQVPQTFYTLGRSADLLTKKAIHDFINWQKDGVLRGNVPGAHCSELPSQSLNAISEIGMIMSYYMNSGDISVLHESYNAIMEYLLLWDMGENGLVLSRKGNWYWFDHGQYIDEPVLENAWYYSALKAALKICRLTGKNDGKEVFLERINKISANFDANFWDGEGYRTKDFYDDRANAVAVLAGLASKEKWPSISKILTDVRNSTPYMEGYVLEALFIMGYGSAAMKRMRERYSELVANNNSTLWEDFYVLGTRNHGWSGGPLTILAKYAAGI